jgi:23S rRNA pseudouridine1911/1915/1917 synthase
MLDVLYEDNHLLVVNKPAMLPTMGVADDRPSLLVAAKKYLAQKYDKPGNVYLGIVSRLDAPVTGVVLLARTSKAASRLARQFRDRDVKKTYWALVGGNVVPASGELVNFLRKDERHRRMHVTGPHEPDAQRAELSYRTCSDRLAGGRGGNQDSATSFLEVQLLTGRKHQIRVQLAQLGFPILGDRKYGSRRSFPVGVALHARRLVIMHPVQNTTLTIDAPLPAVWERWVKCKS